MYLRNRKNYRFIDRQRFEKYLIIESVNRNLCSIYLIVSILALQNHKIEPSPLLIFAVLHLALSIIILSCKRFRNTLFFSFTGAIYIVDIFYITYALSHMELVNSHAYLLYIFPITFWGIRYGVKGAIVISTLISFLYTVLLYIELGQVPAEIILRVVFFLYFSLYIGLLYDKTHKNMYRLATRDGLTSLYNQKFFYESLDYTLEQAMKNGQPVSLALLDLDNFKEHNDKLGHLEGDELLKRVSHIIKENVRSTDIAARYGGDEFVIIFPNTKGKDAVQVAERIRSNIEKSIKVPDMEEPLSVSIGMAVFPRDGLTPTELFQAADRSLYLAKNKGKNLVIFLSESTVKQAKTLLKSKISQ